MENTEEMTNMTGGGAAGELMPDGSLPRLEVRKLKAGLREMPVGTAAVVDGDVTSLNVRRACADLKSEGMLFTTSSRQGPIVVTRVK